MDLKVKPHIATQGGVNTMSHNGILLNNIFFKTLKAYRYKFTHIMFRKCCKFFQEETLRNSEKLLLKPSCAILV